MTGIVIPDGGTIGSASDTDAIAISSGGVVTTSASIQTDTISEKTSANGVSIDGLKVKDYSLMYGSNIGLTVSSDGYVTKPNQPAFRVIVSSAQDVPSDIAHASRVPFGTEKFDVHHDFGSDLFTAPITGKYQLSFTADIRSLTANDGYIQLGIVTSNDDYHAIQDPNGFDGTLTYYQISISVLADMDANDTAQVKSWINGNTYTLEGETQFTGCLIC